MPSQFQHWLSAHTGSLTVLLLFLCCMDWFEAHWRYPSSVKRLVGSLCCEGCSLLKDCYCSEPVTSVELPRFFRSSPFNVGRSRTSRDLSISSFPKFWYRNFQTMDFFGICCPSPISPPGVFFCCCFCCFVLFFALCSVSTVSVAPVVSLAVGVCFHAAAAQQAFQCSFDPTSLLGFRLGPRLCSADQLHCFPGT